MEPELFGAFSVASVSLYFSPVLPSLSWFPVLFLS
jgi:hypothetical protein